MRGSAAVWLCAAVLLVPTTPGAEVPAGVSLELSVEPEEATVGQTIAVRLTLELEPGIGIEAGPLGPSLGPFSVVDERWEGPMPHDGGERWRWEGVLAAYRPGDLELPSLRVRVMPAEGPAVDRSGP